MYLEVTYRISLIQREDKTRKLLCYVVPGETKPLNIQWVDFSLLVHKNQRHVSSTTVSLLFTLKLVAFHIFLQYYKQVTQLLGFKNRYYSRHLSWQRPGEGLLT
jgi:hypothetical protein